MYHHAKLHFKKADPILYVAAERHAIANICRSPDVFRDIIRAITGQQLSGKAAETIFKRLEDLVRQKNAAAKITPKITPQAILALKESLLRACGLSGSKAATIRALAETVVDGKIDPATLHKLTDGEIREALTSVKGIGPWTAEMILMFSLGRTDVFSPGDLGLRKGIMRLYGLRKLPSDRTIERLARAWSPYRTYAARVIWRVADEGKEH